VEEVRLLPYHSMGIEKAHSLRMDMETFEKPDEDRMMQLHAVFEDIKPKNQSL